MHLALIPLNLRSKLSLLGLDAHCRETTHIAETAFNPLKTTDRSALQCARFYLASSVDPLPPAPSAILEAE